MKKGGGKIKGGAYEREICERLSLWISEGKDDDLFWRSAGSGSRATNSKSKGLTSNQCGDIVAINALGNPLSDKFFIECKFYKRLGLDSLIYGTPTKGTILNFWLKTKNDSNYFNKQPMLIVRQNNRKDLIGLNDKTYHDLKVNNYLVNSVAYFPSLGLHLYFLEEFLTNVDPVSFLRMSIGDKGNV